MYYRDNVLLSTQTLNKSVSDVRCDDDCAGSSENDQEDLNLKRALEEQKQSNIVLQEKKSRNLEASHEHIHIFQLLELKDITDSPQFMTVETRVSTAEQGGC